MLRAPLDVLVVRRLGVPGRLEVAMGAIAGAGGEVRVVWNEQVLAGASVGSAEAAAVERLKRDELARQETAYRFGRPRPQLSGRDVVLVDDGLTTGSTMRAAALTVGEQGPERVIVAVPVAGSGAVRMLEDAGAEVVCPWLPA